MKAISFRTEISCNPSNSIGLNDRLITTGSCFADQLGGWLAQNKFNVLVNPFGTSYNPISIHRSLTDSLSSHLDETLFVHSQQDELWHHYDFHSRWASQEKESLGDQLSKLQNQVLQFFKTSSVLMITYGTSWVYELKDHHCIVSNCHKVPAKNFNKRLLSVEEITTSFSGLYKKLLEINSTIRIILTVSPVRHIKDTLVLNSVSKSILRMACHKLSTEFKNVEYFPSFEIMMDDLRDYRFYDRDKIHPNEEAVDYISMKFSDQYFSQETISFIKQWTVIRQALNHRSFFPQTNAHQKFLRDLLNKLKSIQDIVPVEEEINSVQSQIHPNA